MSISFFLVFPSSVSCISCCSASLMFIIAAVFHILSSVQHRHRVHRPVVCCLFVQECLTFLFLCSGTSFILLFFSPAVQKMIHFLLVVVHAQTLRAQERSLWFSPSSFHVIVMKLFSCCQRRNLSDDVIARSSILPALHF